jgi:hypothetical protein
MLLEGPLLVFEVRRATAGGVCGRSAHSTEPRPGATGAVIGAQARA